MKILYTLSAYLPYMGGAQIHIHNIARRLVKQGHVTQALTFWSRNRNDWLLGTTLSAPLKPKTYVLDQVSIETIHLSLYHRLCMLPWVALYYPLKPLAILPLARLIYPFVYARTQNTNIVHNSRVGREPLSLASLWAARSRGIPFCITTLHHPKWMNAYDTPFHLIYKSSDGVIALTNAEREMLVRLGVRQERIMVLGHGADVSDTTNSELFREKYRIQNYPIVLFIAEKRAYKGFQHLVAAANIVWEKHPTVRFIFIGPRTNISRKFFASVQEHRIIELDTVSLQEKTDALAACNIFCLPSTQESFGGVYLEAWSQAKPVIGCSIPSSKEVIKHNFNGLLVNQKTGDIAEKIIYLLDNPVEATRMGLNGQKITFQTYSWDSITTKMLAFYKQLA